MTGSRNRIVDEKWHDLAQRFDAGELTVVSPPMSFEAASAARWAFYQWRNAARRADRSATTPTYRNIYDVVVTLRFDEPIGKWELQFAMPKETELYKALDEMLGRTNAEEPES